MIEYNNWRHLCRQMPKRWSTPLIAFGFMGRGVALQFKRAFPEEF